MELPRDACLNGLRVLDLTGECGQLAGRILADLGADVLKIEPLGGDPLRLRGPFLGGETDPNAGAQWIARNAGKRSVVMDLASEAERVRELAQEADVLIETFPPGFLARFRLDYESLATSHPRLVYCSITPWGSTGPRAMSRGSDLTVAAASGNLYMTGDPDRAPLRCSLPVSHYHGGAEAAAGILMALWHRDRTGRGKHVDVSLQETMLMTSMSHPAQSWLNGNRGRRSGAFNRINDVVMREIWPCKDGFVSFALRGGPARIPGLIALVQYMDENGAAPEWLKRFDWKTYNHNRVTQAEVDRISQPIAEFFLTKTMRELYAAACERNLMLAPANTEREVLESGQLASRDFFTSIDFACAGRPFRLPARFANWNKTGLRGGAPPLRDEAPRFGTAEFPKVQRKNEGGAGIFSGLIIVEFGAGAAIPLATRYFADQGATVLKIESRQRPDFLRILRDDGAGKIDESLFFNILNCNKLSAGLNLKDPRAIDLAKRLVRRADVVVENFSPGVMRKWGLDYDRLKEIRPDLIMVSTCLWGQTGPERQYPGFGGQGSALAGFNYVTGWPDREPLGPFGTITDSLSPRFVAVSIAAALLHRERTGEGSFIDLSQVEVGVYCLSEWLLAYQASGRSFGRCGNRSLHAAPHGVFPALGEDRWVAIAIHDDDDWMRFRKAIGSPPWAMDVAYETVGGRLANADALERLIASWTAQREPAAIEELFRGAGLDCAAVLDLTDLSRDAQLRHRGHFNELVHSAIGSYVVEANGIRFSDAPQLFVRAAPCLAADNERVYREILGLSREEFEELAAAGVLS